MSTERLTSEVSNRVPWFALAFLRLILPVLFCAAGAVYIYGAFGIQVPPLGDELGPRLFPLVLGTTFFIFSLIYAANEVRLLRAAADNGLTATDVTAQSRAWLTLLIIALYCLLLSQSDYLIATSVFVFTMLTLLRFRGVFGNILAGALIAGAFYLVFGVWLGVPLPIIGW